MILMQLTSHAHRLASYGPGRVRLITRVVWLQCVGGGATGIAIGLATVVGEGVDVLGGIESGGIGRMLC